MKTRFKAIIDGTTDGEDILPLRYFNTISTRIDKLKKRYAEKSERNKEKGLDPPELDITIDIDFEGRSIKSNAVMWSIYRIQAYYMNKELKSVKQVTPDELYQKDMIDYAERHRIKSPINSAEFFRTVLTNEKGKIKAEKEIDGYIYFEVWETSSYWNSQKMAEFIEIKLYELEQAGITRIEDGNLDKVFNDFEKWKQQTEGKENESNND